MLTQRSLNPYYTGIHLHVNNINAQSTKDSGLNPYYTGIHLHHIYISCHRKMIDVLILIILEYIYIVSRGAAIEYRSCLNPYYTGIHLHAVPEPDPEATDVCLNPYYTGIHLHILQYLWRISEIKRVS